MKVTKKAFSLLLAFTMLLGLANFPVYAEASLSPTQTPKALSVPNSMNTILEDGFEDYKDDAFEKGKFSTIAGNNTYVKIENFGEKTNVELAIESVNALLASKEYMEKNIQIE